MEQNRGDDLIDLVKALLLDTRNKTVEKVLIVAWASSMQESHTTRFKLSTVALSADPQ